MRLKLFPHKGFELEKLDVLLCGKAPPRHLYHYTSINGLEGILGKRSLWASQIHFLNDTQEFKYSFDIFEKVLLELRKELPVGLIPALGPTPPPSNPKELLARFYSAMKDMLLEEFVSKTPICVFSLSEKGDLLSQWRGYCSPGGGYSIGFRTELLIQFLKTCNLYIEPCIYDEKKQEAIVKQVVSKTGQAFLESSTKDPTELQKIGEKYLLQFFVELSRIASILKHPSFHEECEWRIITTPIQNKNMSFRVRKSMLIPYFSISLKGIYPFPIDEIIIGPAPEQRLPESSLRQFALQNKLNISIKTSKTPYREL